MLVVIAQVFGAPPGRALPTPLPAGVLEMRALDVGQGDALLLRMDDRAALIDTGPDGRTMDARVLPRLASLGVSRLDYLLLTHSDADHIGGTPVLLRSMSVGELVMSTAATDHPVLEEACEVAAVHPVLCEIFEVATAQGVRVRRVESGQTLTWHPQVEVMVLNPRPDQSGDDNDLSVVLRVVYGNAALLLTGDLTRTAEGDLLELHDRLTADVLKVGHHGSDSSTSAAFLAAVAPQVAVVTAGRDNAFDHPRSTVLERLRTQGASVFRTDLGGDVAVRTDGVAITVLVERA